MQFKTMDRTRFNWFSLKEIKELEQVEDKLGFINSFSFGPFVPINLYHFFHNLWDFYILERIANVVYGIMFYVVYMVVFFNAIFKARNLYSENIKPIDTAKWSPDYNLDIISPSSQSASSMFSSFFTTIIVMVILIVVISYAIKIFQGLHCKRLSWNRCEWKDYASFEQGERSWNIVGIIFFSLQTLAIFASLALLIFFSRSLHGMLP